MNKEIGKMQSIQYMFFLELLFYSITAMQLAGWHPSTF